MYYEIHGRQEADAPTLLLCSGLGGSAAYWAANLPALVEHFRVICYDQRGTGRSPAELPEGYSIAQMAQELDALLEQLQISTCDFVGHALGGLVGLELARQQPSRIRRLVPINAWAAPNAHSARCFDARIALLSHSGPAAYIDAQPIFLYPPVWLLENAEQVARELAHALQHFPGVANTLRRIGALRAFDISAVLTEIRQPVLVMASRDDTLVPWTQSRQLAEGLPNASLALRDFGGHAFNLTEQAEFDAELLAFLLTPAP
ncbi:aminoacrylate hydrolase [Pseudomonas cuatrocienegasensis]|uniref:Putative carbamate hydrolase RutD n=1 Tax=Pseudomonas cuatrocienegasensis TaxID=543360 RepID=A0ABY1B6D7_9PSED|nr:MULTISPECIES: pyrimidine utilization protein D [Pseudomonas]OEC36801.1 pyrimidine utilization protein D [Pseudomonas sp. 21C1]SEQ07045.1 aminoacrylate hydrolase [Pseudomonas cuatrocienegasensis]